MNRRLRRGLLAAFVLSAFAAAGCSGADAPSSDGAPTSAAARDTTFASSSDSQASAGIGYYDVHADGSGTAYAPDGAVVARFRGSFDGTHGTFEIEAHGASTKMDYTLTRRGDGSAQVEGVANGSPLSVTIAKDGHVLASRLPPLDPALRATFDAMSRDFATKATEHWFTCAVYIALLGASLYAAPPFVMQSAIGVVNNCF